MNKTSKILLSTLLAGTILSLPVSDALAASNKSYQERRNAVESARADGTSTPHSKSKAHTTSSQNSGSNEKKDGNKGADSSSGSSSGGGDTWQQGGAATNQVGTSAADMQKNVATASAWIGAISSTVGFATSWIPEKYITTVPFLEGLGEYVQLTGGPVSHGLNFDLMGAAVDGWAVADAYNKKAKLSEEPKEMTAAVRNIGEPEELEGECEGDESGTCNELNAKLDGTEVHVSTLQNVGLEALEDVAGIVLMAPEELMAAAPYIKEGFGSTTTEVKATIDGKEEAIARTLTEEDREKMDLRKSGHLQLTGTAGVARADLGTVVAGAERDQYERLSSYVGSGKGLIANVKVLCGLDLTLAQRLNLLNMLYGQQAANEAAAALQQLQDK